MKKPSKETVEPVCWVVYVLRKKALWLGSVEALDKAEALKKAAALFEIRQADR
jgi:hypothetical protein